MCGLSSKNLKGFFEVEFFFRYKYKCEFMKMNSLAEDLFANTSEAPFS